MKARTITAVFTADVAREILLGHVLKLPVNTELAFARDRQ